MKASSSVLRVLQRVLVWLGVGALTLAGGTAVYGAISQRHLVGRFEQEVASTRGTGEAVTDAPADLREGDVIGRLEVPRIGLSVMVLQGVGAHSLTVGAGHVPGTPLPGSDGNVAIAAHRDTFFRRLKGIRSGDDIRVATVRGTYDYIVESTEIVDPHDTEVLTSRSRPELTLITCYPFYFVGAAPKRFIVHARPPR